MEFDIIRDPFGFLKSPEQKLQELERERQFVLNKHLGALDILDVLEKQLSASNHVSEMLKLLQKDSKYHLKVISVAEDHVHSESCNFEQGCSNPKEKHVCPFLVANDGVYDECDCCDVCTGNCAKSINEEE